MPLHGKMIHPPSKKLHKNMRVILEIKITKFFYQENLRKHNFTFRWFPYDKELFMNFLFSFVHQLFSVNFTCTIVLGFVV